MKKADGRFHYGYYTSDAVFSLFVALTMVAAGLTISYTGLFQYLAGTLQHSVSIIGGIIAAASI
jgi:divalent metal cation (Fe/Co/Zn/Cd) transporter